MASVEDTSSGRPSLYVPLPKPPTAFSLTVRKLLGRVREGAVRVPDFQRPLRWTASDVSKLFDSILKGYPVGSLLFWKRSFPAAEVTVGVARFEAPATEEGWAIVDGQQRTTALAAALSDLPQAGDVRWDLAYDPVTREFVTAATPATGTTVPLRVLGDLRRLGQWLRDCDLDEALQAHVETVQQRILDYEMPAYLLETSDVDALRGVFARLNSTGVAMRADEVFHALLGGGEGARGTQRPTIDLHALQQSADLDGFGEPPRSELLKCVLAISGVDPSRRLDGLGDAALAGLTTTDRASDAVRRAVAFLQTPSEAGGAGIPAYAFIPYPVVFVLLARWFDLFPEPDETTRRTLARWVWRGIATGVHQRAAVSAMRMQVRQIRDGDEQGSLASLLQTVGEPPTVEWRLDTFSARSAGSRVELLALLALRPRSRWGDVSWRSLLTSGERVAREIIAMPQLDGPSRELGRTAANRVLLDSRHTGVATDLRTWSWDEDREALESHLIDRDSLSILRFAEREPVAREEFLRRRGARVRAHVTRFLGRRAGAGEPTVFSASAYYEEDELAEPPL